MPHIEVKETPYLVTYKTASNAEKCLTTLTRSLRKDTSTFFELDKNQAILQPKGYKCMLGPLCVY